LSGAAFRAGRFLRNVIPAEAGIRTLDDPQMMDTALDSRFRGNDKNRLGQLKSQGSQRDFR
jgi:hypothetical protein